MQDKPMTYTHATIDGLRRRDAYATIEDAVDAWHEADTAIECHAWLGMTLEEYFADLAQRDTSRTLRVFRS